MSYIPRANNYRYHMIMCTKETRPNNNRNILTTFTRLWYTPTKTEVMVFPTKAITIKSSQKIRFQYTVPEVQALAYKTKQYHNTRGDGISFVKPTTEKRSCSSNYKHRQIIRNKKTHQMQYSYVNSHKIYRNHIT